MPDVELPPAALAPEVELAPDRGVALIVVPSGLHQVPRACSGQRRNWCGHLWWVTAISWAQGMPKSTELPIWLTRQNNVRGVLVSDGAERPTCRGGEETLFRMEHESLVPVQPT